MKKLALHLDDLMVESFATSSAQDPRGTAHGHMIPPDETVGPACTGQSCNDICSYQICPAAAAAGAYLLAFEPAATVAVDTGDGVCLTCEPTCNRC